MRHLGLSEASAATIRRASAVHPITAVQALAWVLARGEDLAPIPGTKRRRYLQENAGSLDITLSAEALVVLSDLQPVGERYPDMSWVDRDTAPLAG